MDHYQLGQSGSATRDEIVNDLGGRQTAFCYLSAQDTRKNAAPKTTGVLTGGRVITDDIGVKLETVGLDWLGTAQKIVIDKDNTTIVEGKASDIQARIKQIRTLTDETTCGKSSKLIKNLCP